MVSARAFNLSDIEKVKRISSLYPEAHGGPLEETAEDVRDPPKDAQGYARIIKSTMKRYLKGLAGRFEQYSAKDESFEINFFQFLEKAGDSPPFSK